MAKVQQLNDFLKECVDKRFNLNPLDLENILNGDFDSVRKLKTDESVTSRDQLAFFHKCSENGWNLTHTEISQIMQSQFTDIIHDHLEQEQEKDYDDRRIISTEIKTNMVFSKKCMLSNYDKLWFREAFHETIRTLVFENPDEWKNPIVVIGRLNYEVQQSHYTKSISIPIGDRDNRCNRNVDVYCWTELN